MKILQFLFSPLCWICRKIYHADVSAEVEVVSTLRDTLTGLYSTTFFKEKMEHEQARFSRYEAPFALIFVTVDELPDKPDSKTMRLWEKSIKNVGEILLSELRTVDVIARYGPVTFAALLPETKILHARFVAERLRVTIKDKSREAAGTDLENTVCVGVGEQLPEHSIESLTKRVENALIKAKSIGSDRVGIASDDTGDAAFESE